MMRAKQGGGGGNVYDNDESIDCARAGWRAESGGWEIKEKMKKGNV